MPIFRAITLRNDSSLQNIDATFSERYSYPPLDKQNDYSVACTRVKLPSSAIEILKVTNSTDYVVELVNRFDRVLAESYQGSATKVSAQSIPLSSVIPYYDEDTLMDAVNKTISFLFYSNLIQGALIYNTGPTNNLGCLIDKYTTPASFSSVNYNANHNTVTFEGSYPVNACLSPAGANATALRYIVVTLGGLSISSSLGQATAGTYSLYLVGPSGNKVVFYSGDLANPNDLSKTSCDISFADFGLFSSSNLNITSTNTYYPLSSFFIFNTTDKDVPNAGNWKVGCLFKSNNAEAQPWSATLKFTVNFVTTVDAEIEVYSPTFSFESDGRISFNYEDRYTMSGSQLYLSPKIFQMLNFPSHSKYDPVKQMYLITPSIIADINFSSLGTMFKTTQRISSKYLMNNISKVYLEAPALNFEGELTSVNKTSSNVLCDFLIDDTSNLGYLVYTTDASVIPQKNFKLTSPDPLRYLSLVVNIEYNNGFLQVLQIPPGLAVDVTIGFYKRASEYDE